MCTDVHEVRAHARTHKTAGQRRFLGFCAWTCAWTFPVRAQVKAQLRTYITVLCAWNRPFCPSPSIQKKRTASTGVIHNTAIYIHNSFFPCNGSKKSEIHAQNSEKGTLTWGVVCAWNFLLHAHVHAQTGEKGTLTWGFVCACVCTHIHAHHAHTMHRTRP